jgi:hypothetical protein
MRLLSKIKMAIVPPGSKPRRIQSGAFQGITMALSLEHNTQMFLGLFERETHQPLKRLSDGIATAIDIGASQGEYTLYFLMLTAARQVYSFEPDQAMLPVLHRNLEMNRLRHDLRLVLSPSAIGRDNPLDSLSRSIEMPCLIKMDVDGAEAEILEGARSLNTSRGIRWLIETHSKRLERDCVRILETSGFHTTIIPNAWWRVLLPEQRVSEQNRWLAAWKD